MFDSAALCLALECLEYPYMVMFYLLKVDVVSRLTFVTILLSRQILLAAGQLLFRVENGFFEGFGRERMTQN